MLLRRASFLSGVGVLSRTFPLSRWRRRTRPIRQGHRATESWLAPGPTWPGRDLARAVTWFPLLGAWPLALWQQWAQLGRWKIVPILRMVDYLFDSETGLTRTRLKRMGLKRSGLTRFRKAVNVIAEKFWFQNKIFLYTPSMHCWPVILRFDILRGRLERVVRFLRWGKSP